MIGHSTTPGKHLGAQRSSAPKQHRKSGGGNHRGLAIMALLAVLTAFAAGAFLMRPKGQSDVVTPEAFVEQMVSSAQGAAYDRNIYGGALIVERKGNSTTVTATDIPPSVCVSVGLKLVRKGILTVNGVTPQRVSAAKLSELCNQEDSNPILVWSPRASE
jgi:hypothetical protein